MPGATLTSRKCTVPSARVDDQVDAGEVAQAERLVRRDGDLGDGVGGRPDSRAGAKNSVAPAV